jgi:hypothetical protein
MPRAGQDKQIRAGKQLMKLLRHTPIQIRVGSAKNNSDGPPKLFELESCLRAGSYGWQQIFVQAQEGRPGPSPQTFARSESRLDNRRSYFRGPVDRLLRDDTGRRNLAILDFLAPSALPIGVAVVFPPA